MLTGHTRCVFFVTIGKKHRQFGDHVWSNKNDEKRQSKCDQVEDPACT